jgi:hypothetical protein
MTAGFYSPKALAAFKNFATIANAPGGIVGGVGAHDAALPMPSEKSEGGNRHAAILKRLQDFASKLSGADKVSFRKALDQAFPPLDDDERDKPWRDADGEIDYDEGEASENPYAAGPQSATAENPYRRDELDVARDRDNPSTPANQTIGGPSAFPGRPTRGGKPLPLGAQDSYSRWFPMATDIGLDPCPATVSRRQRKVQMAMDSAIASGEADYEQMFPMTRRIGILG